MIDMGELPPMDIIQELQILAEKVRSGSKEDVLREVSDLTALLVAAVAREPREMLNEIVIRDELKQLSRELKEVLSDSSYVDMPHEDTES
jgi:hypothetical protein